MKKYEVIKRLVNVHQGIVALTKAQAAQYGSRIEHIVDDQYKIIEPIQIFKGEEFFSDQDLTEFNVRKLSGDYAPPLELDSVTDKQKKAGAKAEKKAKATAAKVVDKAEKPDPDPSEQAEKINKIVDAIALLDPHNTEHWTQDGLPAVEVLKDLLDFDVTADERNVAAAQFNALMAHDHSLLGD